MVGVVAQREREEERKSEGDLEGVVARAVKVVHDDLALGPHSHVAVELCTAEVTICWSNAGSGLSAPVMGHHAQCAKRTNWPLSVSSRD